MSGSLLVGERLNRVLQDQTGIALESIGCLVGEDCLGHHLFFILLFQVQRQGNHPFALLLIQSGEQAFLLMTYLRAYCTQ